MNGLIFIYAASILLIGWGTSHLIPTQSIVRNFGEISLDNRRTITMEWIIEGLTLIFIGILVALVTYVDHVSPISKIVYWCVFIMLNILSIVSLLTGFRNSFFAFKLCPFIFTGSSLLILIGSTIS